MPLDAGGVVRLVAPDRQADERKAVGEGGVHRPETGVGHDSSGLGQHLLMWHEPGNMDVGGRRRPKRCAARW